MIEKNNFVLAVWAANTAIETADSADSVKSTTALSAITNCSMREAELLPGTPIITP